MTLDQAKVLQKEFASSNPFARISPEAARQSEIAHRVLLKNQQQEDFDKFEESVRVQRTRTLALF